MGREGYIWSSGLIIGRFGFCCSYLYEMYLTDFYKPEKILMKHNMSRVELSSAMVDWSLP